MNLACDTCPVRDSAACAVLTEDEREAFAKAGRTRKLEPGETLFAAGDDSDFCATLVEGALKVTSHDADGQEQILALIHPAGFVGELFQPFSRHDVVALTECRLCVFSQSLLNQAIETYPSLARALLRRSEEDLHRARDLVALTNSGDARSKLSSLVMAFAQAASASPCHPAEQFELPLSRGDIANMLGLTIETVSRQMGALEKSGAIRRHGKRGIELLDPALLAVD